MRRVHSTIESDSVSAPVMRPFVVLQIFSSGGGVCRMVGRGTSIIASVGSVVLVPQNVPQHPVTPSCSEFESRRRQLHRSDMQKNRAARDRASHYHTL